MSSRTPKSGKARATSGQAMIEFIVALVAILALFAGLIQVAGLTKAHTDSMVEARREAGQHAIMDVTFLENPDYIRNLEPGGDNKSYTRDDTHTDANPADLQAYVVDKVTSTPLGWTIIDGIAGNDLTALHLSTAPASSIGLVRGNDKRKVDVIPAVRDLIYSADSIEIDSTVWMTQTKGIY